MIYYIHIHILKTVSISNIKTKAKVCSHQSGNVTFWKFKVNNIRPSSALSSCRSISPQHVQCQ